MSWLRNILEHAGWVGPRRRMQSTISAAPNEGSIQRYEPRLDVTYEGGFVTREEVREEALFLDDLSGIRLATAKRAAEAQKIANGALVDEEQTNVAIAKAKNEHAALVGDGALEERLRPVKDATAENLAHAELARAEETRAEAEAKRQTGVTTSTIRKKAEKKRLADSKGPSKRELADRKTREENRQQLEQWAHQLALSAARWVGVLTPQGPHNERDAYYAFAGVHYYGARLEGYSDGDALIAAAEALMQRKANHGPLSEHEARETAKKCISRRSIFFEKQRKDEAARQQEQQNAAAVEISRNDVEAATIRKANVENLDRVIHGKRDGEHFDTKA